MFLSLSKLFYFLHQQADKSSLFTSLSQRSLWKSRFRDASRPTEASEVQQIERRKSTGQPGHEVMLHQRPSLAPAEGCWAFLCTALSSEKPRSFPYSPTILEAFRERKRFPSWFSGKESACQCRRMQEMYGTWVQSVGWEDPLEKEKGIHSNVLAWRIPWTEEPGGLQSMGLQKSQT